MAYKSKHQSQLETVPSNGFNPSQDNRGYSVNKWPDNLGDERYPHFVIFFINDSEKGQFNMPKGNWHTDAIGGRSTGSGLTSLNMTGAGQENLKAVGGNLKSAAGNTANAIGSAFEAGIKAVVPGLDAGSAASSALTSGANVLNDVSNAVGSGIKSVVSNFTNPKKRVKDCICLPMPHRINAKYSADYDKTGELGALGNVIMSTLSPAQDTTETLKRAIAPAALSAGAGIAMSGLGAIPVIGQPIAGAIGAPDARTIENIVTKLSGTVLNKRQEQIFQSMGFRQHSFQYLFIPRNKKESESIADIISLFKIYMHPNLFSSGDSNAGSSILVTPAEFDIEYRFKDSENTAISRIATCALASVDVDYTAIGEFISFSDVSHPVAISLSLTFVEMEPLDRTMILKGF